MKVVDEVAAARNEDALFPQGRKALADFVVEGRRLGFVNAELDDRNISSRVHVAQHGPRAMVEAPPFVQPYGQWRKELLNTNGKVRVARCWILHLIQFSRKPAEIVDCPRRRVDCYGGVLNVPVRRHAEDCLRFRQLCSDCRPLLSVGVSEQGVHRIPVTKED